MCAGEQIFWVPFWTERLITLCLNTGHNVYIYDGFEMTKKVVKGGKKFHFAAGQLRVCVFRGFAFLGDLEHFRGLECVNLLQDTGTLS